MLNRRITLILCVIATLALSACGGESSSVETSEAAPSVAAPTPAAPSIDYVQWRQDLAAYGLTDPDMAGLEEATGKICSDSRDELELFLAVAIDDGADLGAYRVNFEHVCPESLPAFDNARDSVSSSTSSAELACAKAPMERTAEEADLAEAMAC